MIDFRVLLGAVALFVGAYAAVSMLTKSAPVATTVRPAPAIDIAHSGSDLTEEPASTIPPEPASVLQERDPAPEQAAATEPPARPERDLSQGRERIRVSAIQAATAYALAPCDMINKAALVVAMSTYLRTLESEIAPADAEPDRRVRNALRSAMNAGGLADEDFPVDGLPVPANLTRIASSRAPACDGARRAERRR